MFADAKIKPSLLLAALLISDLAPAAPLPPKVQTQNWDFKDRIQKLPIRRALEVQSFYTQPIAHGRLHFIERSQTLMLLSADLERMSEFELSNGRFQLRSERALESVSQREAFFEPDLSAQTHFKHAKGFFSFGSDQARVLQYSEAKNSKGLWSITLPFDAQAASHDRQSRALWFWRSLPGALFVIPASLGVVSSFEWSSDSEIVSIEECAPTTLVLAENTSSGFSRFVFFKNRVEPTSYTVFDFAIDSRSDVSRVLPLDGRCENFVVAGSFGLKRVRYPRGSL
jgi:hypothetical protein